MTRLPWGLALAPALLLELCLPTAVPAPGKTPFKPFVGTYEEARKSAAERNVPLLIHLILEGEPQNDDYRDNILPDSKLQALCQRAVVIVSNNGEHPVTQVKETLDGHTFERPACSVFRYFEGCPGHRDTWDPLYVEFHDEDGDLGCPQTILFDPAGKIVWRHNVRNPPKVGEVIGALAKAQRAAGKGLTVGELSNLKTLIARARKRTTEGKPAGAWRSWKSVLEIVDSGTYGEEAKAGVEAAAGAMGLAVKTAEELLVPGKAALGYARLLELQPEYVGTPFEKRVKESIKKAEKNKAIKGEIAAYKLELEAQELWKAGLALLDEDQARKAERSIRRLLRKKYAKTKAAAAAMERFPEWAKEEAEKGK